MRQCRGACCQQKRPPAKKDISKPRRQPLNFPQFSDLNGVNLIALRHLWRNLNGGSRVKERLTKRRHFSQPTAEAVVVLSGRIGRPKEQRHFAQYNGNKSITLTQFHHTQRLKKPYCNAWLNLFIRRTFWLRLSERGRLQPCCSDYANENSKKTQ